MTKAVIAWSGGKDSAYSLYKVLAEKQFEVCYLVTTISAVSRRVSMHGVREELIEAQSAAIGIPLLKIEIPEPCSMEQYAEIMNEHWQGLKEEGIEAVIFGDIFLEDLKRFRDENLARCGITGVYPLWKNDSKTLLNDFVASGHKTALVCCNEKYLGAEWCGRVVDESFIAQLPGDTDPCGENGEFHSFVFDGPLFNKAIAYKTGEIVYRKFAESNNTWDTGFWYLDVMLQ